MGFGAIGALPRRMRSHAATSVGICAVSRMRLAQRGLARVVVGVGIEGRQRGHAGAQHLHRRRLLRAAVRSIARSLGGSLRFAVDGQRLVSVSSSFLRRQRARARAGRPPPRTSNGRRDRRRRSRDRAAGPSCPSMKQISDVETTTSSRPAFQIPGLLGVRHGSLGSPCGGRMKPPPCTIAGRALQGLTWPAGVARRALNCAMAAPRTRSSTSTTAIRSARPRCSRRCAGGGAVRRRAARADDLFDVGPGSLRRPRRGRRRSARRAGDRAGHAACSTSAPGSAARRAFWPTDRRPRHRRRSDAGRAARRAPRLTRLVALDPRVRVVRGRCAAPCPSARTRSTPWSARRALLHIPDKARGPRASARACCAPGGRLAFTRLGRHGRGSATASGAASTSGWPRSRSRASRATAQMLGRAGFTRHRRRGSLRRVDRDPARAAAHVPRPARGHRRPLRPGAL